MEKKPDWKSYEDLVYGIIDELKDKLGFESVKRDAKLKGARSGRDWNVEVAAYRPGGELVIIEVKYRNRPMEAEHMGGFVYRVQDTGAESGIVVTRSGLQEGAEMIMGAEPIDRMDLSEGASLERYVMKFLDQIFVKVSDTARINVRERLSVVKTDEHGVVTESVVIPDD